MLCCMVNSYSLCTCYSLLALGELVSLCTCYSLLALGELVQSLYMLQSLGSR